MAARLSAAAVRGDAARLGLAFIGLCAWDATGLDLPEDEAYDTVAGLLVRELGRIPERGDRVLVPLPVVIPDDDDEEPVQEHVLMRVERMDGLRVDRISLKRLLPEAEAP